jgi:superfamily II DNA or RNA helicase
MSMKSWPDTVKGGSTEKQRRNALKQLQDIPREQERLLIATGRYLGEGFDDQRLDTLFLALPISWKGTLAQYVGRLHRACAGKRETRVHDYVDVRVPMLKRMFERRLKGYRAIGYGPGPDLK